MSRSDTRPLSALTIAGSDSGGGAGIQADLKTFAAHGVHGLTAIAALTAQHTRGVTAVHVPPVAFLRAQIDACFDDFRIGAVKLGMLANTEVITAVADALEHHQPSHIVLDPVMVATSGARLLAADALDALRARRLPLATILTPNIPEAELLLGHPIDDDEAADAGVDLYKRSSGIENSPGWEAIPVRLPRHAPPTANIGAVRGNIDFGAVSSKIVANSHALRAGERNNLTMLTHKTISQ